MTQAETTGARRFLASVRRSALVELIDQHGSATVAEMAAQLRVSEMTIRRDLVRLVAAGRVDRDHGGATAPSKRATMYRDEPAFELRGRINARAKQAIGRAAAGLLAPGETIGLDTGSTTHCLAEALLAVGGLRIFASNLRTATLLAGGASRVYVLGGLIRPHELSAHGPITSGQLGGLWLDTVFIGVAGLTEDGLFDYSLEDTEIKQVFIERANRVVVLCDASKFGRRSLTLVAPLGRVDTLVTDRAPADTLAAALHRADVNTILAEPIGGSPSGAVRNSRERETPDV